MECVLGGVDRVYCTWWMNECGCWPAFTRLETKHETRAVVNSSRWNIQRGLRVAQDAPHIRACPRSTDTLHVLCCPVGVLRSILISAERVRYKWNNKLHIPHEQFVTIAVSPPPGLQVLSVHIYVYTYIRVCVCVFINTHTQISL